MKKAKHELAISVMFVATADKIRVTHRLEPTLKYHADSKPE